MLRKIWNYFWYLALTISAILLYLLFLHSLVRFMISGVQNQTKIPNNHEIRTLFSQKNLPEIRQKYFANMTSAQHKEITEFSQEFCSLFNCEIDPKTSKISTMKKDLLNTFQDFGKEFFIHYFKSD